MHKRLTHFAAGLTLCGALAPLYAGTATENLVPSASTSVKAKAFRITGSKAFSETELLKLVNHAVGKELSGADLAELANRITAHYRAHGFQRAHATLPQQNFANGIIRFVVSKSATPSIHTPLPERRAESPARSGTIKASGFHIIGSKAFSEAELLPLVADAIGKVLTADDLNNLAQRITDHYRQHGYRRARAVVSPNIFDSNIFDGTAAHVVEGYVRFLITKLPIGAPVNPHQPGTPTFLSAPDKAPDGGDPAGVLLGRATWWINRDRADLAQESLNKLFGIAPNHPDGLAALAQLEIKMQKLNAAQATLDTLKKVQPGHPDIPRIEALIRLNGRDKDKLRQARQLAQQSRLPGHFDQIGKALAAFRALYLDNPSDGDLALEYWKLVADTKQGWVPAHDGLAKLVRENPDNLHYRLALAEHETSRLPLKRQALQIIIDMTKLPAYAPQARRSWRRALTRLGNSPANLPLLREYLAVEPGDSGVRAKQTAIVQAQETHRRLLADPNYQAKVEGASLLAQGDWAAAEPLLEQALRARPKDADLAGEMGLLRMRQGRHAQAQELFAQALRLTHGASSKWKSLIKTSQFWQLMTESRDARDAGDFSLAENKLYAALQLDPKEPNAIAALARIQADLERFKEAEFGYRQALLIEPLNTGALNGLLSLYRQQGQEAEAGQMIANLSPEQRNALGATLNRMEADMLQQQADRLLAQGQNDKAIALLEQATQLDADDPWLRFNLAKQYASRNSPEKGLALFDDFLARHPNDPDALYALAQYQSNLGDTGNALATLAQVNPSLRSEKISLLQQRLRIKNLGQQAKLLAQSGRQDDAKQALSEAEAASSGNEELTLAVALAWAEIGDTRHARALFDKTRPEQSAITARPSINWHLRYTDFLSMTGADQELRDELEIIAGIRELLPSEAETLAELRESAAIRMADAQTLAGNPALAHQTLAPFLIAKPDQVRLLLADARAYRAGRQWPLAQANYTHVLQLDQSDREARNGLIETLIASGDHTAALQHLDEWAAGSVTNNLSTRLHLCGLFIDHEEYARAEELIDPLLAAYPNHPRVLGYAAQIAQHAGRLDDEIDYLKRSVAAEQAERNLAASNLSSLSSAPAQNDAQRMPNDSIAYENIGIDEFGSPKKIERNWQEKKLAALIDRRSKWVSSAIDMRSRSGTAGLSQYNSVEIPLEYKTPWHTNDEVFLRTDLVKLDAGSVASTDSNFGSQLLCQPGCPPALLLQAAQGLSLTAGYERDNFRADVGVTPLNFPVSNIVGGIHRDGDFGKLSYSLEASRRPVTGSLLSFAGTKDPRTGNVWGGVVATGGRLGLSLDEGKAFGFWSSASLHELTGRNVLSNERLQIMAGGQWRAINEENRLFSLGLTGMYWHHTQNAGEYTFGHGGYYSPQNYRSLSLPITYGERYPRFSYVLRGAVSASQSQTQDAPYFPTDSAMQAQATALAPTSFITPMYSGGSSNGTGYSLKGAWEYQVEPKLFVGGLLSVDRSDSYSPNRVLFYLRYSLDHPGAQPVFLPPEPVEPSSQF